MPDLPPAIATFLAYVEHSRPRSSPTYLKLLSTMSTIKRRRYFIAVALLASPWVYRQLRARYQQSRFYQDHRRRQESFTHHLQEAEKQQEAEQVKKRRKSPKVGVDKEFLRRLQFLINILVPTWRSKEMAMVILHGIFLVLRTWLSVVVARIDGRIVKELVGANPKGFALGITYWFAIALPATYTNSMIRFLQSKLAIAFRTRLTNHVHDAYLQDMTYYRLLNLDSRIEGPDQLICTDIAKFCDTLASLYSNLAKPLLDTVIFNYQLTQSIGGSGMLAIAANYVLTAWILRQVTPGFGKLAAVEAKLEGDFRGAHTRLITNAEEIAFYHGGNRELSILDTTYRTLIRHVNRIFRIRIFYNMFEDFVIKYAWSAVGLLVCSVPVFFPSWAGSLSHRNSGKTDEDAHGSRTQGFITNKRLMISLADAGGRIMYSYKELAELAGYTSRVYELLSVFGDLKARRYQKTMLSADAKLTHEFALTDIQGQIQYGHDGVYAKDVPIVTPSGDLLVRDLSFDVKPGMHVLVSGPNGVGKSSLMRIISGLWPLLRGTIERPFDEAIIFIPQRPYLSMGTLRDQVIYPHTFYDMKRAGRTDEELMEILGKVHLDYLPEREHGWDSKKEWKDVLSGGEKQRMNLARLFYHQPKFAVLDECTSAVSTDVEGLMYQRAKDMGVTLITISHRPSLLKHHKFLLAFSGENTSWEWSELGSKKAQMTVDAEIKEIEKKLRDEERIKSRITEINTLLGVKVNATKKKAIKIRETHIPKAKRILNALQKNDGSNKSGIKQKCPQCKMEIPVEELERHIRIELLDPKWKEMKGKELARKRQSNLTLGQGSEVARNLDRLAEYRKDIFGGDDGEARRKIETERERSKLRATAAWDGHTASISRVSEQVLRLPENQLEHQMKVAFQQAELEIGPQAPSGNIIVQTYKSLVGDESDDAERPAKRLKK